ncbi:MAG: putative baseplate assembly protein [Thermoanaerobaculia bacterium]
MSDNRFCGDNCGGGACGCGCCEGTEPLTPRTIANRPGLDALAYRVGTHASFLETMKARLSSSDFGALEGLTTRDSADPSLALLDAWALVGDVLTFYQERIANEGYLRTATERRSVLELARLVGYEPRPGVAASTYLAYLLDEGPEALIPAGAAARSVPGPGEQPQTFETMEDLRARAAWNNLQVRLTRPQNSITTEKGRGMGVYLQGTATQVKVNDPLLIGPKGFPALYRAIAVEPDAKKDRTWVAVQLWTTKWEVPALTGAVLEAVEGAPDLAGTLARFSDLDAHGITPKKTTTRVLRELEPLKQAVESGADPAAVELAIEEVLPKLRKELATVHNLGSPKLEAWIGGLIGELEAAAPPAALEAVSAPRLTTSLAGVLETLGKKPRPQVRSSAQLERDTVKLYGEDSDLRARLLSVSRPELRDTLYTAWANAPVTLPPDFEVHVLRARASVFGHNAPKRLILSDGVIVDTPEWKLQNPQDDDPDVTPVPTEEPMVVWLDATYPQILPGSWIVLQRPFALGEIREQVIAQVRGAGEQSRAEYGISAKVTRVELSKAWIAPTGDPKDSFQVVRRTAVFAQSERLPLAEVPIPEPLCGGEIELAGLYDGLQPGRWLIVSGERADVGQLDEKGKVEVPVAGVPAAELVMLAGVEQGVKTLETNVISDTTGEEKRPLPGDRTHSTLTLAKPLAYCYRRDTLRIYGNVAKATHGETRFEVLGSGDASKSLQSFTLKQPPLTYVSAPTPSGIESTLKVRVNDLLWHEAESLAGLRKTDRSYIVRIDDGGQTTVVFGNGERGARLPTGPENVRATYRNGIGKRGNVKKEQITQLATRPLGVKDVINPLPATGGADKESRDQARRNAPLAVLALDRLVSVQDYEDFTRTFAGVGKARATLLSDGWTELVHVTVAGEDDIPIATDSELLQNLEAALRSFGDPRQPLRIDVRERAFLVVEAKVRVLPDYLWEKVEPKVRAAMLQAFGFDRRDLGQDAVLSEAYRAIQGVPGVDYVDVDVFTARDPEDILEAADLSDQPKKRLRAFLAKAGDDGTIHPAQLLYLSPEVADTLILKELK